MKHMVQPEKPWLLLMLSWSITLFSGRVLSCQLRRSDSARGKRKGMILFGGPQTPRQLWDQVREHWRLRLLPSLKYGLSYLLVDLSRGQRALRKPSY